MFNPRKAFGDIVRGYSKSYWKDKPVFFKHFNHLDLADFESENEIFELAAKSSGLLTEKEKIDSLIADELWDKKKFHEIKVLEDLINSLETTKKNLILESQIKEINEGIKVNRESLNKLLQARAGLIGNTVEEYVRRKTNEFYIYYSTFTNSECTERFFNLETFNELEDTDLSELISIYNNSIDQISGLNVKKLAVNSDFQSNLHLAKDNAFQFYGIPVTRLSLYQSQLFIYGGYFKPMLVGEVKQELLDDPDKLVEYFHSKNNLENQIQDSQHEVTGTSILGASKSEIKEKLGNDVRFVDLQSLATKKGGNLDSREIMAAFKG